MIKAHLFQRFHPFTVNEFSQQRLKHLSPAEGFLQGVSVWFLMLITAQAVVLLLFQK